MQVVRSFEQEESQCYQTDVDPSCFTTEPSQNGILDVTAVQLSILFILDE